MQRVSVFMRKGGVPTRAIFSPSTCPVSCMDTQLASSLTCQKASLLADCQPGVESLTNIVLSSQIIVGVVDFGCTTLHNSTTDFALNVFTRIGSYYVQPLYQSIVHIIHTCQYKCHAHLVTVAWSTMQAIPGAYNNIPQLHSGTIDQGALGTSFEVPNFSVSAPQHCLCKQLALRTSVQHALQLFMPTEVFCRTRVGTERKRCVFG